MTKHLGLAGIIITSAYFILIYYYAGSQLSDLHKLELNQFGDFLAGIFGPVAIFWIVLGFFQQGQELKNSVETLKLQAKELAASVTQQAELVNVTRETLAYEREIRGRDERLRSREFDPDFTIVFGVCMKLSETEFLYSYKLYMKGKPARDVEIRIFESGNLLFTDREETLIEGWHASKDNIRIGEARLIEEVIFAEVTYKRIDESMGKQLFELTPILPPQSYGEPMKFRRLI
jgi:hypothetical protein